MAPPSSGTRSSSSSLSGSSSLSSFWLSGLEAFSKLSPAHLAKALRRTCAFVAGLRYRGDRVDDTAAAKYTGSAWCDSTEQELINDVMMGGDRSARR
jgi:hypothetical protein